MPRVPPVTRAVLPRIEKRSEVSTGTLWPRSRWRGLSARRGSSPGRHGHEVAGPGRIEEGGRSLCAARLEAAPVRRRCGAGGWRWSVRDENGPVGIDVELHATDD